MFTTSPDRERSPAYRAQTAYDRPSKSPSRVNTEYDRPRTPIESGKHSRDTSASRVNTANYFFQPFNAPYVNGKKNENFAHPSLTSNNIFYDQNYGYKNDLPNDRMLTPVKNDRHYRGNNEDTVNRGYRTPSKSPALENRRDRSEDNLLRTQSSTARRLIAEENPTRSNLNRSVDIALRGQESAAHTRKNSNVSQTPSKYDRNYDEVMNKSPRIVNAAGKAAGANNRGNYDGDNIRDDRSEASTVMSTLSSTGYLCPKCLNKHMAGAKNAQCSVMREQEKAHENKITNMHMRYLEEQEAQKKQERAKRVQDNREVQKKLDADYEARRELKRSPVREKDTSLKSVFDRQEEMRQKQWVLKQVFGTHLRDQMKVLDNQKEQEKQANAQPYNTSLRLGNGYHNKYVDHPATVRQTLQEQAQEKMMRQQREREVEKQAAQDRHALDMKQLQEDQQKAKMKEWVQQRELRDAFARDVERKQTQQREAAMNKSEERVLADQGYNQYKKRQQDEQAKTKQQLVDFKQYLQKQQDRVTYKQKYEERKQQKEGTSFDPSRRIKKKYPCGECSDPYEKLHLTKI